MAVFYDICKAFDRVWHAPQNPISLCHRKSPSLIKELLLGNPKPKNMLIFRFVCIFEYIILLMLIVFLNMCLNLYGWMPCLLMLLGLWIRSKVN